MSAEHSSEAVRRPVDAGRCKTTVYGTFSGYPCGKPGKVKRDGQWYCGRHDPVKVAEKREALSAKHRAEREERRREREQAEATQAALERDAALWRAHIAGEES